jgi:UDP-glucose 4-epimerase
MTVLITGGIGYIGSRLAEHLGKVYGDSNIRLLVRDKGNIPKSLTSMPIVEGDLLNISSLETACNDIDTIIHLAALNEIDSAKDPVAALRVNGEGSLNLINAAVLNNVKRFIYFSTFHVYGLAAVGNITEGTVPIPIHPYAITHHVSEDFIRMANHKKDIEGIVLRLSNGFGCPMHPQIKRWSLVVNDLCLQAVLNNKMVLQSSGKQYRDFVTLTDVCRCVEHLIGLPDWNTDGTNCIYNVGGDHLYSIIEVAKLICERCEQIFGTTPKIIVGNDHNMNQPAVFNYNINKIKQLGFELLGNVEEEIDNTLIFCNDNKDLLKCNL